MLMGLLRRQRQVEPTRASVPAGVRLYAIGDIHGRLDLLDHLLDLIQEDAASGSDLDRYLVFLGDYVDRGDDSRGVIDRLATGLPPSFGAIHLRGNHEATMLRFLADLTIGTNWLNFGGGATLASYGITLPSAPNPAIMLLAAQRALREQLPPAHRRFLQDLRTSVTVGDYLFVHAGIRPGIPLDRQDDHDLMWIRDEFLESPKDHGKVVIHGHTITFEPEMRANRIGIDTGAFATGRLTALVLEGDTRRFLST
ncbi:MAG TPA: metallophosphoesterase family protein [Azospirillaceae bacterium]|nr:metallophosphoesterase family protein [Azospirillaceae bacterium]